MVKIPCYEVYDKKGTDCTVFPHARMDDLQNHIYLLLDDLEPEESIRIEFRPYTQNELDELKESEMAKIPPSIADEISLRMAEEITKFWRGIDTSPRRSQHKAKLQVAIGQAIVQALIDTTKEELGDTHA